MRRTLFHIAAGLSFVLWTIVVLLWASSYFMEVHFSITSRDVDRQLRSVRGEIICIRTEVAYEPSGLYADEDQGWHLKFFKADGTTTDVHWFDKPDFSFLGVSVHNFVPFSWIEFGTLVVIPHVWLAVPLGILPALWLWRRRDSPARRMQRGLCVKCGYDLRGSAGAACPECGELPAHRRTATELRA